MTKATHRRWAAWAGALLFLLVSGTGQARSSSDPGSGKDVEERLRELEDRLAERDGRGGSNVSTFFAEHLALGGYFEHVLVGIWGPDTDTQVSASSHVLGINLGADLGERFRLVGQYSLGFGFAFLNQHANPSHGSSLLPRSREFGSVSFGSVLAQAYVEYETDHAFRIQTGMGYVPFGQAFQFRDPVLFLRRGGPQLIRTTGSADIIIANPFWTGVHVLGEFVRPMTWGYDLYSMTPLADTGTLGGGSRLWAASDDRRVIVGASAQAGKRHGTQYVAFGADLKLDLDPVSLLAEAGRTIADPDSPFTVYVEPSLKLAQGRWILYACGDYLRNPLGGTSLGSASVSDPYVKLEYGGGINYVPRPGLRMRLGALIHDYVGVTAVPSGQNRDYYSVEYSTGVVF